MLLLLIATALLAAGHHGANQARLRAKLADLAALTDQLRESSLNRVDSAQLGEWTQLLRERIAELERDGSSGRDEVASANAWIANAEQRFNDALKLAPATDNSARAHASFGLRDWQNALDAYAAVLKTNPKQMEALARIPECYTALGKEPEARAAYSILAKAFQERGDSMLQLIKVEPAIFHYSKAIQLRTQLVARVATEAPELARALYRRGSAHLYLGKPAEAVTDLTKAVEIQSSLANKKELAFSQASLGDALFYSRKSEAASAQYVIAAQTLGNLVAQEQKDILPRLAEVNENAGNLLLATGRFQPALAQYDAALKHLKEAPREIAIDTARVLNNRGVLRRAERNEGEALIDFEAAIKMLTAPRVEPGEPAALAVKLEAAMGYKETSLDALFRTRFAGRRERQERAVLLAVIIKNRAYTHLVQKNLPAAKADFQKAAEIFTELIELEGEKDLSAQRQTCLKQLETISP